MTSRSGPPPRPPSGGATMASGGRTLASGSPPPPPPLARVPPWPPAPAVAMPPAPVPALAPASIDVGALGRAPTQPPPAMIETSKADRSHPERKQPLIKLLQRRLHRNTAPSGA